MEAEFCTVQLFQNGQIAWILYWKYTLQIKFYFCRCASCTLIEMSAIQNNPSHDQVNSNTTRFCALLDFKEIWLLGVKTYDNENNASFNSIIYWLPHSQFAAKQTYFLPYVQNHTYTHYFSSTRTYQWATVSTLAPRYCTLPSKVPESKKIT